MPPRKILTAQQMRLTDARTSELGIPSLVLMENAAHRVVEFLHSRYGPLERSRIVVFCGKGNNGGDGLAVARQLFTRARYLALDVLLACEPEELSGDAAENYKMFQACGGRVARAIEPRMQAATLLMDALLGSGLSGPARGKPLEWIRAINSDFPLASVVAVDVPSGMPSDSGDPSGEFVRADATVSFTAPRVCHVVAPNCRHLGVLRIGQIGTPASLYQDDASLYLGLIEPLVFQDLLAARDPAGNKGLYGHVLVVAGSRGKTGAAAMCGMSALRAGAGLATVSSAESAIPAIAAYSPELMTEFLPETSGGVIARAALRRLEELIENRSVVAIGPGIGQDGETAEVVHRLFRTCPKPMAVDADALNLLSGGDWPGDIPALRVLTPHPGEMARLTGLTVRTVQADRLGAARKFARERGVTLVLKGERTLLAFPDGRVWVNPTGSPSMATGGTGDVLTGMIAGFLAQNPTRPDEAVAAAVYLHGRAGELGAVEIGEQAFVATDLMRFLPSAIREVQDAKTGLYDPDSL